MQNEKELVLKRLQLFRDYMIDVTAAGHIKAEITKVTAREAVQSGLFEAQKELHERIQNAETELVTEIMKDE